MLKSRRPFRPPVPGYSLALPAQGAHGEVQVQQRNERDVDKFFFDVDDTMVSPMITTSAGRATSPGTFHARPLGAASSTISVPHPTPAPSPPHAATVPAATPRRTAEPPAGSYAAALVAPPQHPGVGAPADGTVAQGDGSSASLTIHGNDVPPSTNAKFIHVNNTNLFVLVDGISMFLDGKSTYTGSQDANLLAFLEKKRKERQEKKERKEKERLAAKQKGRGPAEMAPVDTVEKAIRDIQDNVANIFSPKQGPQGTGGVGDGTFGQPGHGKPFPSVPSLLELGSTAGSPTTTATPLSSVPPTLSAAQSGAGGFTGRPPAVVAPKVPTQFASLFSNATRPVSSPLFGRQKATTTTAPTAAGAAAAATPSMTSGDVLVSGSSSPALAAGTGFAGSPSLSSAPGGSSGKGLASPNTATPVGTAASAFANPSVVRTLTAASTPSPEGQGKSVNNGSFCSQSSSQLTGLRREASTDTVHTVATTETASIAPWGSGTKRPTNVTNVRLHQERYPSLPGDAAPKALRHTLSETDVKTPRHAPKKKQSPAPNAQSVPLQDIGHSNGSLDIDDVEYMDMIGSGSQGKVFRVKLEGKFYAIKCMDVREATEATNSVERQGRKHGLIKELNMIRLQRERPPPKHLMQMFNAVAILDGDNQQLNVLIELMAFGVEDCQQMVARLPQDVMMAMTQSTFRDYMAGDAHSAQELKELVKRQNGPPMHVLGRNAHLEPQPWEFREERQTPLPEIVLSMLAFDILKGLQELHEDYAMVHCDLKPANVLLCYDRKSFKIADFGCSSTMDARTHTIRREGVDLGSKLYKAPERLTGELASDMAVAGTPSNGDRAGGALGTSEAVEFSAKADVWSLGIMLLELANGVHPCSPFKEDFWDYGAKLKLQKMIKPLSWSLAFCDFVVRCLAVKEGDRWSVRDLLRHPFIRKGKNVPRGKLKLFMDRLERESATYQRRQQRELLRRQIELSTAQLAQDNHARESRAKWLQFNAPLKVVPDWRDPAKFPALQ